MHMFAYICTYMHTHMSFRARTGIYVLRRALNFSKCPIQFWVIYGETTLRVKAV